MKISLLKKGNLVIVPIRFISFRSCRSRSNNAVPGSDNAGPGSKNAGPEAIMHVPEVKMQVLGSNYAGPRR